MLNPHETSLVLLGIPRDLKGLLHTLNAIIHPTKEESIFFVLLCFYFQFHITKRLAIYKFGGVLSVK
jgi:hypothetical protein